VNSWYGVFAPPATPKDVIARINADIVSLLGAVDVRERLASLGAEPQPLAPEAFVRFVRDDIAKWARVVKESGAKID
jgi:tripartite-type tricarboxylate transporter receptor subunit TctC